MGNTTPNQSDIYPEYRYELSGIDSMTGNCPVVAVRKK